ncbi:MAG: PQQ-binding-like beta-propeller repeat protein [Deltaproteobacteria bacterium]|jgi:hypothetical protein|nr:PQQ-binding-like beta-propeller repeat protein [Deltaproteobacteria bacterium]MBW2534783.1 PQQ-binding-like beta-propeller repeat protein [Deltaproteobacteria bacterium]
MRRRLPIVALCVGVGAGAFALGCGAGDETTLEGWVPPQRDGPKNPGKADTEIGPYYVGPESVGQPWGTSSTLRQFRGNPTHTWYGPGALPTDARTVWRFPDSPLCSQSTASGTTKTWCGSGWTGQPSVWQRPDGITEVIVGAYDRAVHFIDAESGTRTRPDFVTGDIIKGSVTLDPDGYPLLYFGSRDNKLRILALDRDAPTELWALDAYVVSAVWNNDWDGNPSIVNDVLFEGGENSWFFAVKLNRSYVYDASAGKEVVQVEPRILAQVPGYENALFDHVGDRNVSIENSVAVFDDRVYFGNSGGRILGLDITRLDQGLAPIVFDFWVGEDVDASLVVDDEGMLYAAIELERRLPRASEIGQLVKLDPYAAVSDPYASTEPIVWSVEVPAASDGDDGGIWATPALYGDYLYVATHPGELLAVNRHTGAVTFRDTLGWHAWSSPVVADGRLVVTTCSGGIRFYSLADPAVPTLERTASIDSGACIESTPALHDGRLFVGARDGYIYGLGE